ncbi:hypothetical protein [Pseudomonas sp. QTF5]|nr:hypothetical protein [Pseudomonas sp. QTF5]
MSKDENAAAYAHTVEALDAALRCRKNLRNMPEYRVIDGCKQE